MAYVFYPLVSRIRAWPGKQFLSTIVSLGALVLAVIIPIATVVSLTAVQIGGLVAELTKTYDNR